MALFTYSYYQLGTLAINIEMAFIFVGILDQFVVFNSDYMESAASIGMAFTIEQLRIKAIT